MTGDHGLDPRVRGQGGGAREPARCGAGDPGGRPTRLLVVATYRDVEATDELRQLLADLRGESWVTRLALRGLDEAEAADLVSSVIGHDLDHIAPELARVLHRDTNGNPFFIAE